MNETSILYEVVRGVALFVFWGFVVYFGLKFVFNVIKLIRWFPRVRVYKGDKKVKSYLLNKDNFNSVLQCLNFFDYVDSPFYGVFRYNEGVQSPEFPIYSLIKHEMFVSSATHEIYMGFEYPDSDSYYFFRMYFCDAEELKNCMDYYRIAKDYFSILPDVSLMQQSESFKNLSFEEILCNLGIAYGALQDLRWFLLKKDSDSRYTITRAKLPVLEKQIPF